MRAISPTQMRATLGDHGLDAGPALQEAAGLAGASEDSDSASREGAAEVEEALHHQMEMQKMLQLQLEVC